MTRSRERALLILLSAVQFTHVLDFMVMLPLGPLMAAGRIMLLTLNKARSGPLMVMAPEAKFKASVPVF